ncbi:cysteine sulfinic acid decarboxylase [Magnaporthiopsis poae ATCC 64411]|uniref:Cysteine sulfinic acid decarboxylase n=1 Tax=Magnaporthiopsis poae (strain ATCC 64411 / 73-15) TaxID=644358 RepID=A0A0C4EC10_MAGP6|nr:cysteine sulfinic acid decarboxylase [Magnaporthiopsis poae ATCC 64411]
MTAPKISTSLNRADELETLIDAVKALIVPFVRDADEAAPSKTDGGASVANSSWNSLVEPCEPLDLVSRLAFELPEREGGGREGLLQVIQQILRFSVNTWDQGFLDKLYSSTNAVGVVSELLLSVLNTNVHVYQVSPALTVIEKTTARTLAGLFGFDGPRAGGVTIGGGSASNLTAVVIARNTLFPSTKTGGNGSHRFALFTSEHGHYSIEKAASACGIGSPPRRAASGRPAFGPCPSNVAGRMLPSALRDAVLTAREEGMTTLFVNATAGTTVLGSFDPFEDVAAVCRELGLWMHIDASWGGSAIFSARHRHRLAGTHLANSVTVNPHKMLNVPVTCSFLLGPDMDIFHRANTLPASYLFHGDCAATSGEQDKAEVWDLADLTLQCGRRGDSLKLALSWIYYGASGLERQIDSAFAMAAHLAGLVEVHPDFTLVSANPPPCLQVCFYYTPGGGAKGSAAATGPAENSRRTREMVAKLMRRGFMIDYAPGEHGSFFRVVVNCQTLQGTVEGLMRALESVGKEVVL